MGRRFGIVALGLLLFLFLTLVHAEDTKDDEKEIPDLPEESIKPVFEPKEQPQDQGSDEDTELGAGVEQRELVPDSGLSGILCDGKDCAYSKSILPGSRGFKDSYFPLTAVQTDKKLLEHLIANLKGKPYKDKEAQVKRLVDIMNQIRKDNADAVEEDAKKDESERIYTEPKGSTGTLEAPPSTYTDSNELLCSISTRTREVCAMCGGERAYRFRGYHVERMSPREQRFVPTYPFSTRSQQEAARKFLRDVTPQAINTLSLSAGGGVVCISSNPPATVHDALLSVGYNVTGQWLMRGMPDSRALSNTAVLAVRIDSVGRRDVVVPRIEYGDATESDDVHVKSVMVTWADSRVAWGGETRIVPFLALKDAIGVIEVRDAYTQHPEAETYINGSIPFGGGLNVAVVAHQLRGARYGSVTGVVPAAEVSVTQILMGFGCEDRDVLGTPLELCDPTPVGDSLEERIREVGLDRLTLTRARVESTYDVRGEGKVYYRVEGDAKGIDDCTATAVATFTSLCKGCKPAYRMLFAFALNFDAFSTSTPRGVLTLITGAHVPEALSRFKITALSLVFAKEDIDMEDYSTFILALGASKIKQGVTFNGMLSFEPASAGSSSSSSSSSPDDEEERAQSSEQGLGHVVQQSVDGSASGAIVHTTRQDSGIDNGVKNASRITSSSSDSTTTTTTTSSSSTSSNSNSMSDEALSLLVSRFLMSTAPMRIQGPVSTTQATLTAHAGELTISPGVHMVDTTLTLTLTFCDGILSIPISGGGCGDSVAASFKGQVLLPISGIELLRLAGELRLPLGVPPESASAYLQREQRINTRGDGDARAEQEARSMYFEATVKNTIYSALGVSNMHLSYGVVRQPLFGGPVAWYAVDGVLSLGAACSPQNIDVPTACLKGTALIALDSVTPSQHMMVGTLPSMPLRAVVAYVGASCHAPPPRDTAHVRTLDSLLCVHADFTQGATISYAMQRHAISGSPRAPPTTASHYVLEKGYAGQGIMTLYGIIDTWATWVSDIAHAALALDAVMPRLRGGTLSIAHAEGDASGPTLSVRSTAMGGTRAWMIGYVRLWGHAGYAVVRFGGALRFAGRFGGTQGLHASVSVQVPWSNLTSTQPWGVSGSVTRQGVRDIRERVPRHVRAVCRRKRPACTREDAAYVMRSTTLCAVDFELSSEGAADVVLANVHVHFNDSVYTTRLNVSIVNVDATAAAIAPFAMRLAQGAAYGWEGRKRVGTCQSPAYHTPGVLPTEIRLLPQFEIPGTVVLREALLQANEDIRIRSENDSEWNLRRGEISDERWKVGVDSWRARKEAFDYLETIRSATQREYQAKQFTEPMPERDDSFQGLLTDAYYFDSSQSSSSVVLTSVEMRAKLNTISTRLAAIQDRLVGQVQHDAEKHLDRARAALLSSADRAVRREMDAVDTLSKHSAQHAHETTSHSRLGDSLGDVDATPSSSNTRSTTAAPYSEVNGVVKTPYESQKQALIKKHASRKEVDIGEGGKPLGVPNNGPTIHVGGAVRSRGRNVRRRFVGDAELVREGQGGGDDGLEERLRRLESERKELKGLTRLSDFEDDASTWSRQRTKSDKLRVLHRLVQRKEELLKRIRAMADGQ